MGNCSFLGYLGRREIVGIVVGCGIVWVGDVEKCYFFVVCLVSRNLYGLVFVKSCKVIIIGGL